MFSCFLVCSLHKKKDLSVFSMAWSSDKVIYRIIIRIQDVFNNYSSSNVLGCWVVLPGLGVGVSARDRLRGGFACGLTTQHLDVQL